MQAKPYVHSKPKDVPRDKSIDKGKSIVKESLKKLDGKRCFKCQGYNHCQADYPKKRALTIREIKEINQIHSEISEEEE